MRRFGIGLTASAVVALLAVSAACKSGGASDEEPVPGERIELASAGSAPRRPLRFGFVPGARASFDLRLDLQMDLSVNHVAMARSPLPGVTMRVTVEITEVQPDGSARWKLELDRASIANTPGVAPETASALHAVLPTATTFSASGRMTARGQVTEATFAFPDSADPAAAQFLAAIEQLLRQMASPLPVAPVGVGARWDVRTDLDNEGMKLTRIATNELVAIHDGQLEIRQTVRESALPQTIAVPESPGATTELTALDGHGTATLVVDLARPWPLTYSLELALETDMTTAGQPLELKMSMLAQATSPR